MKKNLLSLFVSTMILGTFQVSSMEVPVSTDTTSSSQKQGNPEKVTNDITVTDADKARVEEEVEKTSQQIYPHTKGQIDQNVLAMTFVRLNHRDLFIASQVNHQWRLVASKIMSNELAKMKIYAGKANPDEIVQVFIKVFFLDDYQKFQMFWKEVSSGGYKELFQSISDLRKDGNVGNLINCALLPTDMLSTRKFNFYFPREDNERSYLIQHHTPDLIRVQGNIKNYTPFELKAILAGLKRVKLINSKQDMESTIEYIKEILRSYESSSASTYKSTKKRNDEELAVWTKLVLKPIPLEVLKPTTPEVMPAAVPATPSSPAEPVTLEDALTREGVEASVVEEISKSINVLKGKTDTTGKRLDTKRHKIDEALHVLQTRGAIRSGDVKPQDVLRFHLILNRYIRKD